MRPSVRFVVLAGLVLALGIAAAFVGSLGPVLLVVGLGLLVVGVVDGLFLLVPRRVGFRRTIPGRFALQQPGRVGFEVVNRSVWPLKARLYDGVPEECRAEDFPQQLPRLRYRGTAESSYEIVFLKRGDLVIERAYLEYASLFGFWWRSVRVGEDELCKVYPDYVPVLQYGLLATADRAEQMGIVKPRIKGLSKEFHQLRDYQEGDAMSQIDWKATSRFSKLITREYQEERDQTILVVPDCSIRTRAIDGEFPILDHLLNAALLFSYIALKQGDKVGVMNFGGGERYLAPVKGASGMSQILNHLYDYESRGSYGDFSDLASRVMTMQKKRALVVVLTNLRSEDQFGSLPALRLIAERHLLLVASVRESVVEESLQEPVRGVEGAQRFLGALAYEQDTTDLVAGLRGAGLTAIHEGLERYPIALANEYLDLRFSGRW
ncbi:MAG: DUF58 domain-containing protein [Verrucomicrobiota bacterium]